jgi:hypothetical protein
MKTKVYQLESPRSGNAVPNQYEIRTRTSKGTKVMFQSYNTIICEVNEGGNIYLDSNSWDYSRTTLKYLKIFLSDFIGTINTNQIRTAIMQKRFKLKNLNK